MTERPPRPPKKDTHLPDAVLDTLRATHAANRELAVTNNAAYDVIFGWPDADPPADRDAVAAKVLADGNYPAVAEIAADHTLNLEEKGRRIIAIHTPAAHWKAARWAELLGVTDSRIRQLAFWKMLREADKLD
jgi:hypothetical protein